MVASTECPEFTKITANTSFITIQNIAELIPNVFNRSVGTQITLSCVDGYKLVGNKYIECLSTGRWNATVPACQLNTLTSGNSSSNVTSITRKISSGENQMTILIIIVNIVAVIALITLLTLCCCLFWRNRQRRYEKKVKVDHLYTDYYRPRPTHVTGSTVYYNSGYTRDQNDFRWDSTSAEEPRHIDEGRDQWMEIQPYFKIPRPYYVK
ncbi:hypothetical protein CHS0354_011805 [Potamilus streckersoni]|uniref:Sushi domain-containing protein n=1 Tax=Potamilus streckersoni TaxID=2493646 RepID=A0AAE0TGL0_9BIVA|nr:hypothetical protein CHS0354_011805 [Potamilus streckersoni]